MKKKLTLICMMLSCFMAYSQQTWNELVTGSSVSFTGADFINDNVGFVSGAGGTILKTTDGGTTWLVQTTGISSHVSYIHFLDANNGFAVSSATVLKTTNGGATWTASTPSAGATLACVEEMNGSALYITGSNGLILKSTDLGVTWTTLTSGTSQSLYAVYFTNANIGYAVGNNGTVVKTTNAGASWVSLATGTTYQLLGLEFTDATHGYAVGGSASSNTGAILTTSNAGASWTLQTINSNYFGAVRFLNPTTGFISGGNITANTSTILKTNDGGTTWTVQPSSSNRQYGLSVPSFNVGYSAGLNGKILKVSNINIGIEEILDINSIVVAPNPFQESFIVNLNIKLPGEVQLRLFSETGAEVLKISKGNFQIGAQSIELNADAVPAGIYFIEISAGGKRYVNKIIKTR